MVYKGKPSTACHACRKRRIRCDEIQLPRGCSSCRRAGMTCPGYRNKVDAMFIHQTDKIMSKCIEPSSAPQPRATLVDSSAEFGMAYFFKTHVMQADSTSNIAHARIPEGCLTTCMQALGLATYATVTGQAQKRYLAREAYSKAINEVNTALRSDPQSKEDATLFAVVLLAYFEAIVGSEDHVPLEAWSNHISGTAALIQKRGMEQMQSADGRMLFMIATTNMISNCIRSSSRLPPVVHTIWDSASQYVAQADPIWQCHSAWLGIVDLYSDLVHKRKEASEIVAEALRIDKKLSQAFADVSGVDTDTELSKARLKLPRTSTPEFASWYDDSMIAEIWTSVRNGRLILHSIAAKTLWQHSLATPQESGKEMTEQMRTSSEVIQAMKQDILASTPQQLLIGPFANETNPLPEPSAPIGSPRSAAEETNASETSSISQSSGMLNLRFDGLPILRTSCGYNFVWSLVLVSRLVSSDKTLQARLCDYMRLGAKNYGMQQASTLANQLEVEHGS